MSVLTDKYLIIVFTINLAASTIQAGVSGLVTD